MQMRKATERKTYSKVAIYRAYTATLIQQKKKLEPQETINVVCYETPQVALISG